MLYTNYGDTPAIRAGDCTTHAPDGDALEAFWNGDAIVVTCAHCGSVRDEVTGTYRAPQYLTRDEFREAFAVDTANYCAGRW